MSVRLQRGDLGLFVAAVAAVVLIATFLAMTGGSPAEDDESAPATTAVPRTGLVRVQSDADPDLEWSDARGAFRVECVDGRVSHLDAKVTDLPTEPRYAWRVVTDARSNETAPLTSRPGVHAELLQGDGEPTGFRTTDAGKGTVRFTFDVERRDVVAPLGLTVLDVEPEDAFVLAAPLMTCRGSG